MNFISFNEVDWGSGTDQLSAESSIPQGYSERLLNVDPTPQGYLRKRSGYASRAGWLPVRVNKFEGVSPDRHAFYLDAGVDVTTVDLTGTRSTPLVVYGRLGSDPGTGDFSDVDAYAYYPSFTPETRNVFGTGTSTNSLLGTEHAKGDLLFVGLSASTSQTNNNGIEFWPDTVTVEKTSGDVSVSYTNDRASFEGFIHVLSGAADPGRVYVHTEAGPISVVSIPTATHQLVNANILTVCYQDTGTTYEMVRPDVVSITAAGNVEITFSEPQTDLVVILRSVSTQSLTQDAVAPGATVSKSFTVTKPFLITGAYEENLITGEKTTAVYDSLEVVDGIATVTYTNLSANALNFILYYDFGTLATNKISVEANSAVASSFQTTDVQLTIWGLSHGEIYSQDVAELRAGWVNHIDDYKAEARESLVAGLGGNLFSETNTFSPDVLYPRVRARVGQTVNIGPAFAPTSIRSRGYLAFDGSDESYATVTSVTWDEAEGAQRYTLTLPNLTVNGTLADILHSTENFPGREDWIEITQTEWAENSGLFRIVKTALVGEELSVWVENTNVYDAAYDEANISALAGVFTDEVSFLDAHPFIGGDILVSDLFTAGAGYSVVNSTEMRVTINNVGEEIAIPVGLRVAGQRTSTLIPLRNELDESSVLGLVRGDVISYSGVSHTHQILRVNTLGDTQVSISGSGTRATVTLASGDTTGFAVGQSVLINYAGDYTGIWKVESILSPTEFTFLCDELGLASGTLFGDTIEVTENLWYEDSVTGSSQISVPLRWFPIEAPDDAYDLTPSTRVAYFSGSYVSQPILRSAMSNDTMFFANGIDPVLKYDGSNVYQAGLPVWPMQAFAVIDTSSPAIDVNVPTVSVTAVTGATLTVALGDEQAFLPGQLVRTDTGVMATVTEISQNATDGFIKLATSGILAGITDISGVARRRYYMRLNAIDANSNLIASAVVAPDDFIVDLSEPSSVRLRLISLPVFGNYDFDRIEAEIYSTRLGTVAPFYHQATIPVSFNEGDTYIDYSDTRSDDTLIDLDPISTALTGAELGTGWAPAPIAKYVTSAGGRLVLGNIESYPTLTLRFVDSGLPITSANLLGKRLLVRKDNTDTGTVTNNTDRVGFVFTNATAAASISYTGAGVFTVAATGTFTAGDWVYIYHDATATNRDLSLCGWHQVLAGGSGSFTISTNLSALPLGTLPDAVSTVGADVPVFLGTDYNFDLKDYNTFTSTYAILNALRRLSTAMNAHQRQVAAWFSAEAGASYANGELLLRSPIVTEETMEVVLPTFTEFLIFGNEVRRGSGDQVSTVSSVFPSRVVVSYENFPEIFNRPTGSGVSEIFDINPADGQEITGVIPFFGDSVFGASSKGEIVVVFKTNSIYLIDLSGNSIDSSRIQKIDSRGLGCTAPYSIAPTQNGVMFANTSGIYRLRQDLTVEYIGRRVERIWKKEVGDISVAAGHYSPTANSYKISFPSKGDVAPSRALVYNTTREYTADGYREGSWTEYSSHNVTGWSNSTTDSFFATTKGDVQQVLSESSERPFQDNGEAISAVATLRAMDFGESSIRKAVGNAVIYFRTVDGSDNNTRVLSSINLKDQFVEADRATIRSLDTPNDGLGSTGEVKIRPIRFTFDRRKGTHFQLKFENSTVDSSMEITGIGYRVAGLSVKGIEEAKDTN